MMSLHVAGVKRSQHAENFNLQTQLFSSFVECIIGIIPVVILASCKEVTSYTCIPDPRSIKFPSLFTPVPYPINKVIRI